MQENSIGQHYLLHGGVLGLSSMDMALLMLLTLLVSSLTDMALLMLRALLASLSEEISTSVKANDIFEARVFKEACLEEAHCGRTA